MLFLFSLSVTLLFTWILTKTINFLYCDSDSNINNKIKIYHKFINNLLSEFNNYALLEDLENDPTYYQLIDEVNTHKVLLGLKLSTLLSYMKNHQLESESDTDSDSSLDINLNFDSESESNDESESDTNSELNDNEQKEEVNEQKKEVTEQKEEILYTFSSIPLTITGSKSINQNNSGSESESNSESESESKSESE